MTSVDSKILKFCKEIENETQQWYLLEFAKKYTKWIETHDKQQIANVETFIKNGVNEMIHKSITNFSNRLWITKQQYAVPLDGETIKFLRLMLTDNTLARVLNVIEGMGLDNLPDPVVGEEPMDTGVHHHQSLCLTCNKLKA